MRGDEIKRIQEALQKMKINIGEDGTDGVFGNDGHNAVMNFQKDYKPIHNVHQHTWGEPDGIVGKNTLLAMDEALVSGWKYTKPEKINWADSEFGKALGEVESHNSYSAYNYFSYPQGKKHLNSKFQSKLETMTVKEVQLKQDERKMFAVGRFQIIPNTLIDAVKKLKIDTTVKFDKIIQDRLFNEYLISKKRPNIIKYLEGDGDIGDAMYDWAKEFASAGGEKGRNLNKRKKDQVARIAKGGESYYTGDGFNKAHISLKKMKKVLENSKKNKG